MASEFKLTVFRHANAERALGPGHNADMFRLLSPKGMEQARARAHKLGTIYGPRQFSLVAASPAERTMMTAEIVTGIPRSEIRAIQAFCFEPAVASEDWAAFTEAFNRHNYAPLQTYLDDEAARDAVIRIGGYMASALASLAEEVGDGENVAIFTHAVMGVALVFCLLDPDATSVDGTKLTAINMSEAGGYTAHFKNGQVVAIDELPSLEAMAA